MSFFIPKGQTITPSGNFSTVQSEKFKINELFVNSINMNGGIITNLGAPTNNSDAANKQYVDSQSGSVPGGINQSVQYNDGGIFSGDSNFLWNKTTQILTGLNDPINLLDAANKQYVDNVTVDLTGPITSIGNVTSIASQTGTGTTFVMNASPIISNLDVNSTIITNVSNPIVGTDAVNKNYVDGSAGIPQYTAFVQKNPGSGKFLTIEAALASITTSSITEPWIVEVGPGIYYENVCVIPTYVSVKGSAINPTVVRPNIPNQHLFIMGNTTEISFMTLKGVIGSYNSGYSAVYCEDVGDFAQMHKISIHDFDICIENFANLTDSILYVEYTDVGGDYTYGTYNHSGSGFNASIVLEDYFSYPSNSATKIAVFNEGIGTDLQLTGSTLYGGPGMKGIVLRNGAMINSGAVLIKDFDSGGIISENIGPGQILKLDGITFIDCIPDFSIENIGSSGYFFGNSPRNNHFIINGSSFFVAGIDSNFISVATKGGDYTSIKNAVDDITDSSSSNPYIISIGPGIFTEDVITLKQGIFLVGFMTGGTIIMPTNSNNHIIDGIDGSLIRDLFLTGATGATGIAIYLEGTTGAGMLVRDCGFSNNFTHVKIHGAVATTVMIVDRCSVTGNMDAGFIATNVGTVTVRFTLSLITYQDLVLPACNYLIYATGVNVILTCQNIIARVVLGNTAVAFYANDGCEARIQSCTIKGFDKLLYVPSGSSNVSNVVLTGMLSSDIISKAIDIQNANTVGYWDGQIEYSKIFIPDNCTFFLSNAELTIITVRKSGGNFTSIRSALDAITDASDLKRYVIQVGSGTFTEPSIVMKPYVIIIGQGRASVIIPDGNHHIIYGSNYSELDSLLLRGAPIGYAAIYHSPLSGIINTSFTVRNIFFGENDILCWAYADAYHSHIILFSCIFGTEQFNYGFRATNNNNTIYAKITIIGCTSDEFVSPHPSVFCYASGENCKFEINGLNAIQLDPIEAGTIFFWISNGSIINLSSVIIQGYETGLYSENSGIAPQIVTASTSITDCTNAVVIDHPDTYGSIDVIADRDKITINPLSPITLFIVDPINTGISFSGPLNYSETTYNNITDISSLLVDCPTMGLLTGGLITAGGILTIDVSSGTGYTYNSSIKYQEWTGDSLLLTANSNLYIAVNSNNVIFSSAGIPDNIQNIILGLVSTNTDILYIQTTGLDANHWSNNTNSFLREAIGPVYVSGSQVAELGIRTLDITQGEYYFTNIRFLPNGGSPVTFDIYYTSLIAGIYNRVISQTVVPNTSYNNAPNTLTALTPTFFTKHLLLLLGGPSESYALVYGQDQYLTQGLAEAAGLPIVPSFITDAFVRVVSIVVQEGTANIISFIDERPRIGFASTSTTGVITVHGDLLGLSANDHPQYLLANGGAPGMSGNLDMNLNDITNVGLFNGFDVSAHASRHAFNGADPLSPALAINISEISDSVAFAGTNNTLIPRADHQHPHGNRGGGSLHANVIAAGASGFMTGVDKTKLDGLTNTPLTNTSPVNVTKDTAAVGISTEAARSDHKHDITTAAPITTLLTSTANAEGIATTLARSDHTHEISSDTPATILPDQTNYIGNSTAFARADHVHNIATATAVGIITTTTNSAGAGNNFSKANHTHAVASGVPSNQTIALAVATGTSINFARADHIHTFSTNVPVTINTNNSEGTSTSFSRADHVHAHGNQTSGTMHAAVIAGGTNGFMTGTDKTKLDLLTLGGSLTTSGAFASTFTMTGITSVIFPTSGTLSTSTGTVTGVTGTTNRITSTGGTAPAIDISALYIGQTSITTLGTIGTGTWNGTTIEEIRGGTGQSTYTLGDTLYSSSTNNLLKLSGNITTTKQYLSQTGTGVASAAPSWVTISGSDITGVALTQVSDTNITLTLGGTPATSLLQATSITAGWSGQLSLTRGGTNASLTASNGGIVYSGSSSLAILSGTATANQVLLSGLSTTPSWSTATYPTTTTINQILYSSAGNVIGGLTTGNSGVLVTSAGGIPSISSTLPSAVQGNITSVGTVATGTWNASVISGQYGGTGVANTGSTITLGGSLTTSGAFASTFNMTGITSVTFPTSGTLMNNTLTSGNILVGSAGNVATSVTMSGDATIVASGALTLAPAVRQLNDTFIITGVTYTTPSTITTSTNFKITLIGGGGGGGGTNANNTHGAGGGAGGVGIVFLAGLAPSTGYTIAIGGAGTAGTAGPGAGGTGGNTTITINATTYTASGGVGGAAGGGTGVGGAGGTTTNIPVGSIAITGQRGGYTATTASNLVTSGRGGSSGMGFGLGGSGVAGANNAAIAGQAGTGYGSGGGGATGVGQIGGIGGAGAILIEFVK